MEMAMFKTLSTWVAGPPFAIAKFGQCESLITYRKTPALAIPSFEPRNNPPLPTIDRLIVPNERNNHRSAHWKRAALHCQDEIRFVIRQLLSEDHATFLVRPLRF